MGTKRTHRERKEDPVRDNVTGLINRVGLELLVEHSIALSRRDGQPFTLLAFDVARVDQTDLGTGSATASAIGEFARLWKSELRGSDVVTRSGKDQIAVLLPWTDEKQSEIVIDHLASVVYERNAQRPNAPRLSATVNFATFDSSVDDESAETLLSAVLDRGQGLLSAQSGRTIPPPPSPLTSIGLAHRPRR